MDRVKIKINNTVIDLEIVQDEASMKKGLSGVESLPKDGGMMFLWKKELQPIMIMPDMKIDLDFIGFDKNKVVKHIASANKDFEGEVEFPNVIGVIEVNKGFNEKHDIKVGDVFDILGKGSVIRFRGGGTTKNHDKAQKVGEKKYNIDKTLVKNGKLYLLDENGEIVMELSGKERVFSIEHTKELFELAKEAEKSGDYTKLGTRLKEIMEVHDTQEPEYAETIV